MIVSNCFQFRKLQKFSKDRVLYLRNLEYLIRVLNYVCNVIGRYSLESLRLCILCDFWSIQFIIYFILSDRLNLTGESQERYSNFTIEGTK